MSTSTSTRNAPRRPAAPTTEEGSVLSTLNDDGSRRWLRPRPSDGRWITRRRAVAYFLIAIFTAIPHLRLHDRPLVLLDLTTRRFTILGHTFYPTDTLLLALFLVGVFLSIFLFTALFGRVWCGWACPQTVYMEFLFRPIERFFEGTPGRAKKGWLQTSGAGKFLKYPVYFFASCFLAHTFLAYFVSTDTLRQWVTQSPFNHPAPFLVMAVVTGLMLFDFCFFREQTCLVACPYGRMQSTLLDRDSLIVSYDRNRGEPRGKAVALPVIPDAPRPGDCVDCGMCVATCPTGIDIRNGLQMECVHCTQCMDACDTVMAKLQRPLGLIRYSSQSELAGAKRHVLRPRTIIYPVIIAAITTAFLFVLLREGPANVTVLRSRGAVYTTLDSGSIGNQIQVKIVNRRELPSSFSITTDGEKGVVAQLQEKEITLAPGEMRTFPVLLVAPPDKFQRGKLPTHVVVTGPDNFKLWRPYTMAGPGSYRHTEPDHHDEPEHRDQLEHRDQPEHHDQPAPHQETK